MTETYAVQGATYDERPRRRRGRRVLIVLLVLLLVLAGLLVLTDRIAVGFAERAIAEQVSREMSNQGVTSSPPDVAVAGFPFLTQVAAGRYESISIVARDVQGAVNGNQVSLPQLDIDARDVRAPLETLRSGQGEVIAGSVEGTATITYDTVAKFINQPGLKLAEQGGKLAVTAPLRILGQELTVQGTANLTVDKGQVKIRFDDLNAEGLPTGAAARALLRTYAKSISVDVPLPELPFQLSVQEVRVLPEGLTVSATATEVPLKSGS